MTCYHFIPSLVLFFFFLLLKFCQDLTKMNRSFYIKILDRDSGQDLIDSISVTIGIFAVQYTIFEFCICDNRNANIPTYVRRKCLCTF